MKNISVFIADYSAKFLKELSTYIDKESGLTLAGTAQNGEEAYKLILKTNPDVVVLDLVLPVLDGYEVLKKLNENTAILTKIPKIIICSSLPMVFSNELTKKFVDSCLLKPQSGEQICKVIRKIALSRKMKDYKEIDIEKITTDILHDCAFAANSKGYYYCRSAIIMLVNNTELQNNMVRVVYPEVAKKFNTTAGAVERAIRHSIQRAWERGDLELKNKYFSTCIGKYGKPTNCEFLLTIADIIRLEFGA